MPFKDDVLQPFVGTLVGIWLLLRILRILGVGAMLCLLASKHLY